MSFAIDKSDYIQFGFGFMTLNLKMSLLRAFSESNLLLKLNVR